MSDQPQKQQTSGSSPPAPTEGETQTSAGPGATRLMIYFIVGLVLVVVVGCIAAGILALTNPGAAGGVQIIRDFFIIVMALEGILIGAALTILVLQLARLTSLLQNEIRPILEQTNDTVKTVKGTATFVSRNVADPVIRAGGFLSWLVAVIRELLGLRRVVTGGGKRQSDSAEGNDG